MSPDLSPLHSLHSLAQGQHPGASRSGAPGGSEGNHCGAQPTEAGGAFLSRGRQSRQSRPQPLHMGPGQGSSRAGVVKSKPLHELTAPTRTNAHQKPHPHQTGSKAQQTGGVGLEKPGGLCRCQRQMPTAPRRCGVEVLGWLCDAGVTAPRKADYLQFRREELRRQRPTEVCQRGLACGGR